MNTQTSDHSYTDKHASSLAQAVLDRIQHDAVTPSPRWRFRIFEYGVWVLWVVSILFGAVSVAVIYFSAEHARFALSEATHRTAFAFYLEVLPYIWIILFTIMAVWAYYNLRHTRHGYRYPFWQILISSLIFSFIGGLVLHWFNLGMFIDHSLGQNFASYPSVAHLEERMWEHPSQGLLVGQLLIPYRPTTTERFVDDRGVAWTINTSELQTPDRLLLLSGLRVRLLGTTTSSSTHQFHVCGVFPWEFDRSSFSIDDMRRDRQTFLSRMRHYIDNVTNAVGIGVEGTDTRAAAAMPSICAQIGAAKRVGP